MKIQTDSRLCRDCQACTLACSLYHEKECNLGLARLVVSKDMARYAFNILFCQHCDEPACLLACPTEAMLRDERGVVLILDDACIRCGACAAACPYNALFYYAPQDRYLKCDLCAGRAGGPVCVELCPVGALTLS
jgi:Fe-S-cluster-containing dehydrogenase component